MELNRNIKFDVDASQAYVLSVERGNNNGRRSGITIINRGPDPVTIAVDAEAEDKKGIYLYAGGQWSDHRDGGYWPTQKQITAICGLGASADLSIQERVVD